MRGGTARRARSADRHPPLLWQEGVAQLTAWRAQHAGSCHVPRNTADAGRLPEFVAWARREARRGSLTQFQIAELDAMGFVWRPDVVRWLPACLEAPALQLPLQLLPFESLGTVGVRNNPRTTTRTDTHAHAHCCMEINTKPQAESKWHATYHALRCWLTHGGGELSLLRDGAAVRDLPAAVAEAAPWLERQLELYGSLRLTPVKVKLLRALGACRHVYHHT